KRSGRHCSFNRICPHRFTHPLPLCDLQHLIQQKDKALFLLVPVVAALECDRAKLGHEGAGPHLFEHIPLGVPVFIQQSVHPRECLNQHFAETLHYLLPNTTFKFLKGKAVVCTNLNHDERSPSLCWCLFPSNNTFGRGHLSSCFFQQKCCGLPTKTLLTHA